MIQYAIVAIIIILISLIIFVIFLTKKDKGVKEPEVQNIQKEQKNGIGINEILEIVSNPATSKNQLFNAARILFKEFSIPPKVNGEIPDSAKPFFSFILLLASHPNADAKLISYVNLEMKSKNPSYSSEIDSYEEQGISSRNKRLRTI